MGISCPAPIRSKYRTRSVKEALQAAYDLIGIKGKWIQRSLAVSTKKKDEDGDWVNECQPKDPSAVAFCALGALLHVNGPFQAEAKVLLEKAAAKVIGDDPEDGHQEDDIFTVNDEMGYGAVRKMFRLAIKWAGQKQGKLLFSRF